MWKLNLLSCLFRKWHLEFENLNCLHLTSVWQYLKPTLMRFSPTACSFKVLLIRGKQDAVWRLCQADSSAARLLEAPEFIQAVLDCFACQTLQMCSFLQHLRLGSPIREFDHCPSANRMLPKFAFWRVWTTWILLGLNILVGEKNITFSQIQQSSVTWLSHRRARFSFEYFHLNRFCKFLCLSSS